MGILRKMRDFKVIVGLQFQLHFFFFLRSLKLLFCPLFCPFCYLRKIRQYTLTRQTGFLNEILLIKSLSMCLASDRHLQNSEVGEFSSAVVC